MVKYCDADLDGVFHALSDPVRRQVLLDLQRGPQAASALHQNTNISLVAVMKHIAVLESADLIRTEKQGRRRICTFQPERLAIAEDWLTQSRRFWAASLHQLNSYLEGETK